MKYIIDYETRSFVSLKHTNIHVYFAHPSTEVLCCSITPAAGGLPWIWRPGEPFPFGPDDELAAYNLEFELAAWWWCHRNLDWPEPYPLEQYDCLAARSNYDGLPRSLGRVTDALGLGELGKDKEGHAVMLRLSKPQCKGRQEIVGCEYQHGEFDNDPEKHHRNMVYCLQDGLVERVVDRVTQPLPARERDLWKVHYEINCRGVPVDTALCRNANVIIDAEKNRLAERMVDVTGGAVTHPDQLPALKEWMKDQLGFPVKSLTVDTMPVMVTDDRLPEPVREAIKIRMEARDAAVGKYQAILNHAGDDGRCRGQHVYYAAGPGRFQTPGVNFGNLRRLDEDKIPEQLVLVDRIADATTHDELMAWWQEMRQGGESVISQLAAPIRMAIKAKPGHKLCVCDLTAIEMRGLWWAAGDAARMKQLYDFDRGEGQEPYRMMAAKCCGIPIEEVGKRERKIGKAIELGSGYCTGGVKLQASLAGFGIDVPLAKAEEWKQLYRNEHPHVTRYWRNMINAAVGAVNTGDPHQVGPITFYTERNRLVMRLPSGRELNYHAPKVVAEKFGPAIECDGIQKKDGRRRTVAMPTLVENSIQGLCRDLLTEGMIRASEAELQIVLHVYDEIVIEVPEDDDTSGPLLKELMTTNPKWAPGFPLAAGLGESVRYTK